jgi:serine/threonine protein kinase
VGEVDQAHDSNLGRDVAIKVPPEEFAHYADRLSRFRREAQLLAALNHSNIATIFGLENSNGTRYLVMEPVPGETLAQRTEREGAVLVGPPTHEVASNVATVLASRPIGFFKRKGGITGCVHEPH